MHISEALNYNFLFDSHCHLNESGYDKDLNDVIQRASASGVKLILDVGTDIKASEKSLEIAQAFGGKVKSWVGIDPETFIPGSSLFQNIDVSDSWFKSISIGLKKLITENRQLITGLGETGMDFYWLKKGGDERRETKESKKLQRRLFELHLELAHEFNLPLTVHTRGTEKECLEIVMGYNVTGIFHSYTGSYDVAKQVLDHSWGLGVNGIITFPKADELRSVYSRLLGKVSVDWSFSDFYKKGIFFETDGPFLAPQSVRGSRNEPKNIVEIYNRFVEMLK